MKWLPVLLVAGSLAFNVAAAEKPDRKETHLNSIAGVHEATEAKLNAAGINNVNDLLAQGATSQGPEEITARSGLPAAQILRFVHCADLLRITGVAAQIAALLEAADVNTVAELAQRNASNLHVKLQQVNDAKKLTRKNACRAAGRRMDRQSEDATEGRELLRLNLRLDILYQTACQQNRTRSSLTERASSRVHGRRGSPPSDLS